MMGQDPLNLIGQVLDQTYRIESLVGEGSFGVVYRAFHLQFEQAVAVKCLKIPGSMSAETREAFLRKFREEGRLLFQLSQGTLGIVRSIALGDVVTPKGVWVPYVVLEWLEGQSLSDELRQRRGRGMTGRPFGEVLDWLDMPAKALAYAHKHRVAHRDIKPANLFVMGGTRLGPAPSIKVLDFGIAKVMQEGASAFHRHATAMGFSSYTPQYAAPEQFDPSIGSTGPWSDVYSFALVAVEMLTDKLPTEANDAYGLMTSAINPSIRPTPRVRGARVSDPVERVFSRALAVDPTVRFPDMSTFWDALKLVRQSEDQPRPAPVTPSYNPPGMSGSMQGAPLGVPMGSQVMPSVQSYEPAPLMAGAYEVGQAPPMMAYPAPSMLSAPAAAMPMPMPESKSKLWLYISLGIVIGIALVIAFGGLMCTTCVCTMVGS